MNFHGDESLDRQVVERLRADGHTVDYVAEDEPGISDDEVLERANQQGAILLTADKDFGEREFRLRRVNAGVVLLRLAGVPPERKAEIVSAVVARHGPEFDKTFTVVTPGPIRIRRRS